MVFFNITLLTTKELNLTWDQMNLIFDRTLSSRVCACMCASRNGVPRSNCHYKQKWELPKAIK